MISIVIKDSNWNKFESSKIHYVDNEVCKK